MSELGNDPRNHCFACEVGRFSWGKLRQLAKQFPDMDRFERLGIFKGRFHFVGTYDEIAGMRNLVIDTFIKPDQRERVRRDVWNRL